MNSVYSAIECLDCGDILISRAHHDFNCCSCGLKDGKGIFIDGCSLVSSEEVKEGSSYKFCVRMGGEPTRMKFYHVNIPMTPREIYMDWNKQINKLAKIDPTIYNLEEIKG